MAWDSSEELTVKKVLSSTPAFVILFVLFMVPTYVLPWLGSNSSLSNAASVANGTGVNPLFYVHAAALAILIALTWIRGSSIGKSWLVVLPVVATIFDMMPVLNLIPFVPTILYIITLILGAIGDRATAQAVDSPDAPEVAR